MSTVGITDQADERLTILRGHMSRRDYVSGLINSAYLARAGHHGLTAEQDDKVRRCRQMLCQVQAKTTNPHISEKIVDVVTELQKISTPELG